VESDTSSAGFELVLRDALARGALECIDAGDAAGLLVAREKAVDSAAT